MASFSKVGVLALLAGSAVAIPSNLHGHMHKHHARQNIVYETDIAVVTNVAVVTEVVTAGAPAATVEAQAPAANTPEPYVNSAGMVGYGSAPSAAPSYPAPVASPAASSAPAPEVPTYGSPTAYGPASSAASPTPASEQPYTSPSAYTHTTFIVAPSSAEAPAPSRYPSEAPAVTQAPAPSQYSGPAPVASSSAAASDSTGSSNGIKRGLLWEVSGGSSGSQMSNMFSTDASKFGWYYNWDCQSDGFNLDIEFVPMFWGTKFAGTWNADAQRAIGSGSKYLLGMNEPDQYYFSDPNNKQADMTAAEAVSAWQQYMEPLAGQAKLVSPAVTSNTAPNMGLTYLKAFMAGCSGCNIHAAAVHWYPNDGQDVATSLAAFEQFVQDAHTTAQKPIWVTEFRAPAGVSDSEKVKFINSASQWLDQQKFVERYSYFMASNKAGGLLTGNAPNELAKAYVSN